MAERFCEAARRAIMDMDNGVEVRMLKGHRFVDRPDGGYVVAEFDGTESIELHINGGCPPYGMDGP
jgi:hypothetical protein